MTSDGVDVLPELRLTVRARTEHAGDVVQLLRSAHEYDPADVVIDVVASLDGGDGDELRIELLEQPERAHG